MEMGQLFVTLPQCGLSTALQPIYYSYYYNQQLGFGVLTFNLLAYLHAVFKLTYFKSSGYHPVLLLLHFVILVKC